MPVFEKKPHGKSCGRCITYLIYHHDTEKVTDGGKEQAVQVVADSSADLGTESVKNDLADNEEKQAKGNITQRPAVVEGPRHK